MTDTAKRFTLDESAAKAWLQRAVAIHEAWVRSEDLPEDAEPRRDGASLPEIGDDWQPLACGNETDVYNVVRDAADGGIIGRPADHDLDFEYSEDDDGGSYRFIVYIGTNLALATRSTGMSKLGDGDEARGVAAALAILDEAVASANWALTHLDEYVAQRTGNLADAHTAYGEPLPGTPAD